MKTFAVLCALLVASVSGSPYAASEELTLSQQRFVTGIISSLIEDLSNTIKEYGLDPLDINSEAYSWALPVPSIFSSSASLENIHSNGLSNIVINRINFSTLATRLTFEIELPRVEFKADKASAEASFFGVDLQAEASGSLVVSRVRVSGDVRVSIGIISGISIRSLSLDFSLGGIESDLNVVVQDTDISAPLNNFLGVRVPGALNEYRADLNRLLEIILYDILNDIL